MSKTKEWVIAEQQEKRHLAYLDNAPEPTEAEQIDIDLYNLKAKELEHTLGFKPLVSEIEMHLMFDKVDKKITDINEALDPDDYNDDADLQQDKDDARTPEQESR